MRRAAGHLRNADTARFQACDIRDTAPVRDTGAASAHAREEAAGHHCAVTAITVTGTALGSWAWKVDPLSSAVLARVSSRAPR